MIRRLAITFFGTGYLPIAPGTWGSFAAAVVFLALAAVFPSQPVLWTMTTALSLLAAVIGIALGRWSVDYFQSRDPKPYVLDEAAGMWLSLVLIPFTGTGGLILAAAVQFVLFRVFDVLKPPPACQAEALPFGWGIMTDDLVAGLYANLTGQILFRILLAAL